jgi:hypothetical protein
MRIKHRTNAKAGMAALALPFIMMLVLAGCPTDGGSDPDPGPQTPTPTGKTYTVSQNGSSSAATTTLTITFAAAESGLTAENITITDGTGKAAKNGALSGTGPAYTLPVNVTQAGDITVTITKSGVDSNDHPVTVYKPAPTGRAYTVIANGSATEATTQLTITFDAAEDGLAAENITITDGTGKAAKNGALSGTGPAYTLPVNVTQAGVITVTITKSGVDSNGHPVTVFKPAAPTGKTYTVSADGSDTEATTQLTITFDAAEDGLAATHITLTDDTGKAAKNGELGGTAPAYTLPVTVTQAGSITVKITKDGVDSNDHPVEVKKPAAPADGPFQTVAEAITYLESKNKGGSTKEEAVPLKMKIDLGATEGDDTLVELLSEIGKMFNEGSEYTPNYEVRYIKLDLSECTVTGDTIATGVYSDYQSYGSIGYHRAHYGALSVVEMKLPACKIPAGVYYYGISPQISDAVGFRRFTNLKTISGGATEAGDDAFPASLTTVDLPALTTIGKGAFRSCSGLTSISFPELTAIPDYAFTSTGLIKVDSDDIPKVVSIGIEAFSSCESLETFTAGNETTSIGARAFFEDNSSKLTAVSLPKVTGIPSTAFDRCNKLTSVVIPLAENIDSSAFRNCNALESVSFPLATTIGDSAFEGCTKLAWADLSKAESFGKKAFGTPNVAGKLATLILGAAPPTLPATGTNNADGIFATTASSASTTELTVYVPNGKKGDYTGSSGWNVNESTNSNGAPATYGAKHPKVVISDEAPPAAE